jgi:hypothetical protein
MRPPFFRGQRVYYPSNLPLISCYYLFRESGLILLLAVRINTCNLNLNPSVMCLANIQLFFFCKGQSSLITWIKAVMIGDHLPRLTMSRWTSLGSCGVQALS